MRVFRIPACFLMALLVSFITYLAISAPQLPDQVATHFDVNGRPNGWMSRSTHLGLIGALGFLLPAMFIGIGTLMRFLPDSAFNLPHRSYWLAPERREETLAYFLSTFLWLSCLFVVFFMGLHFTIIQANSQPHPQLSSRGIGILVGSFLVAHLVWIVALLIHFARPASSGDASR